MTSDLLSSPSPPRPVLGDRSLFPHLAGVAYLSYAGVSPASLLVERAVRRSIELVARQGAGAVPAQMAVRERAREKLAQLMHTRPEEIALTANTSSGVTDIALSFPWQRGDRVLLFEGEFPANVTPWQQAARLFHLEPVFLPLRDFEEGDAPGLLTFERELDRGVRLVAVSAVQFQTGLRMPLEAMARACIRRGVQLFVDGAQACGSVPLDLPAIGVDYLACSTHKWLMGLQGGGFLYVRPDRVAALRPTTAGWLSHEDPVSFLLEGPGRLRYDRPIRRRADLFERGTADGCVQAALDASLDPLLELGVAAIHAHVNTYLDRLEPQLVERGFESLRAAEPERRSCILAVRPPPGVDLVGLRKELAARGVTTSVPDGLLRFAPHWPNHVDEIPKVLAAADACLR